MKMTDFVVKDAILTNLQAQTKDDALREIVGSLVKAGALRDEEWDSIVHSLRKREDLGSTGIGMAIAVPHTKHLSVEKMVGTVAISRSGLDFASIDREPVHVIFMLISPPDRPGDHLRALERISQHLRVDDFCDRLKKAQSADEVYTILSDSDSGRTS